MRLRSHMRQAVEMLHSDDAVGRKLDFLVQEMNREINTIGSKAQDIAIAQTVVDVKAEDPKKSGNRFKIWNSFRFAFC